MKSLVKRILTGFGVLVVLAAPMIAAAADSTPAFHLEALAVGSSQINLSWNAFSGTSVRYTIHRSESDAPVNTVTSTKFHDKRLTPDTLYSYYVTAESSEGQLVDSNTVTLRTMTTELPANLQNFFPVGPDAQPTSLMQTWKNRGSNTLVRVPQGNDDVAWTSAANSVQLKYIRKPLSTGASGDIGNTNLLAWSQDDEPELNKISAAKIVKQYNTWKAIDPNRLVFLNFSGGSMLQLQGSCNATCYAAYLPGADWLSDDIYPVAGWGRPDELGWVGQAVGTLLSWAPSKPSFQFVEVSDQGLGHGGPTTDQFRAEFWDAIIHGARGVFIFPEQVGGTFIFDNTTPQMDTEISWQFNTATSLAAVLQSTINPSGMSATVTSPLETTWRNNGHQYFIVLNFSYNQMNAQTITLTGIGSATQAVVIDPDAPTRTVPISGGAIVDDFGPDAVHIYQVN